MARQVIQDLAYRPLSLQDGNGDAGEFSVRTAKAVEYWINVTAIGASADYDLFFETALFKIGDAATVWKAQGSTLNITATGIFTVTLNRIDHALGIKSRVRWVKTTTSLTFSIGTTILE